MDTALSDPLGIVGTIIDQKYLVEGPVGEGGFSVVYRAQHLLWKEPVALKCFNALASVPAPMRDELLEAFLREGKLMTSLSARSAAVVQARDVGTLTTPAGQSVPFMVLEWLDGRPLDLVLADELGRGVPARSLPEAMALLEPVVMALEVAHARGIAHRDVKPANLLVVGDPRGDCLVKVLDFGIAKVMSEHAEAQTALSKTGAHITAFTPHYGAPEQFSRTHGATGPWTEVYALALVVVELLRGGEPALDGADYLQLAVQSRDPSVRPTPRGLGVTVSDEVEQVFGRALAVAPAERFASAGAFWSALHEAVAPGSPAWRRSPTGDPLAPTSRSAHGSADSHRAGGRIAAATPAGVARASGATTTGAPGVERVGPASAGRRGLAPASLGLGALGLLAAGGLTYVGVSELHPASTPGPASASAQSAMAQPAIVIEPAPPRCPDGMVQIDGGKFFRGSDDEAFPLWRPAHKVQLSTYCIDRTEVTARAYKECVDAGECKRAHLVPDYPRSGQVAEAQHEHNRTAYAELCNLGANNLVKPGRDLHPVNCVTWHMASDFCAARGARLPTEAEWEFAARGSDGRAFPWGDDPGQDARHMNACGQECAAWEAAKNIQPRTSQMHGEDDGFPGTAPVGSFAAGRTRHGVDDLVGNVWEWTLDGFVDYGEVARPGEALIDPVGRGGGDRKAIRGGGFNGGYSAWVNPAFRYFQVAAASSHGIGFRCAKPLEPAGAASTQPGAN